MKSILTRIAVPVMCATLLSACTENPPSETQGTTQIEGTTTIASALPLVTVYKSSTCSCCQSWVTYLEEEGFTVSAINHDNMDQVKADNGLTNPSLKSCHTALVDGYVIEGHVPASDIEKLLSERPDVVGLTAPGMPMMSPGMNSREPKDYDVLAFDKNGDSRVFSSY